MFDPLCVSSLLSFKFSDTSSFVRFAGDDKQWEGEIDRYEGDERDEGERVGDVAGTSCQKKLQNE